MRRQQKQGSLILYAVANKYMTLQGVQRPTGEDVFQFSMESKDLYRFRKPITINPTLTANFDEIASDAEKLNDAPCSRSAVNAICSRRRLDSSPTEDSEVMKIKRQFLTNSKQSRGNMMSQWKFQQLTMQFC
jgi:hypothetical protein